jgi:hypothetical protein
LKRMIKISGESSSIFGFNAIWGKSKRARGAMKLTQVL